MGLHRGLLQQIAVSHVMKQETERGRKRSFHRAHVVQQVFQQFTPEPLAPQALQQQHPGWINNSSSVSRRPKFIYSRQQFGELGASEQHPGGTIRNRDGGALRSVPVLEKLLISFLVDLGLTNNMLA